jgi:hypothetical protein
VRWDIVKRLRARHPDRHLSAAPSIAARVPTRPLAMFFHRLHRLRVGADDAQHQAQALTASCPALLAWCAAGPGIGGISALVAIGGGFAVGALHDLVQRQSCSNAIGTSSAIGLPIAVAGTSATWSMAQGAPGHAGIFAFGYIYLPALHWRGHHQLPDGAGRRAPRAQAAGESSSSAPSAASWRYWRPRCCTG